MLDLFFYYILLIWGFVRTQRTPPLPTGLGLLQRAGAGSIYRSIAAAAARHAGPVNFGPTLRMCNIAYSFHFQRTMSERAPTVVANRFNIQFRCDV